MAYAHLIIKIFRHLHLVGFIITNASSIYVCVYISKQIITLGIPRLDELSWNMFYECRLFRRGD